MYTITVKQFVEAPLTDVWPSWEDFGRIDRFHPAVHESRLLGDTGGPTRVGMKRECELTDGKHWLRERITEYEPGKTLAVEIYESSLPLRSMHATLRLRALTDTRTETVMTVDFMPRRGFLGKLTAPLLKRRLRPMIAAALSGNAAYVEQGAHRRRAA